MTLKVKYSAPQVANDTVVVQAYDGRLIGLDKDSGDQRWVYSIDPPVLTLRGTATPVIDEGVVYTGFSNGKLTAIDIKNGNLIWGKLIAIAKGQAELDRIIDVDASPNCLKIRTSMQLVIMVIFLLF